MGRRVMEDKRHDHGKSRGGPVGDRDPTHMHVHLLATYAFVGAASCVARHLRYLYCWDASTPAEELARPNRHQRGGVHRRRAHMGICLPSQGARISCEGMADGASNDEVR